MNAILIASAIPRICRQRLAAAMALFAMFMLFLGPVFSQLEALEQHSSATVSAPAMAPMSAMNDCPLVTGKPLDHPHQEAAFHWFDQCGYCSLWQHFPTAPLALPVMPLRHQAPTLLAKTHVSSALPGLVDYSRAQPRGPPTLS